MAKDRKKLQHIHSSIADKQPTPQSLEVGEIAVNNAVDQEFLSLKNSENKVVRFSSDGQIIEWIERKEVMPYEGYTRGSDGPTGTTGPNSVTNDDLLQNKSNIIIKLNQVAASATTKHNVVNGAKDIYNKEVNPTEDGGVTDGAGFAIDMSRYAMNDANPSFSSVTVSAQTNLSGNTYITNGASANTYGTDTGHTLEITTTDVIDRNTNWTEEITNKQSTVTNETDKITIHNESATTRNTVIGTNSTTISGNTELKVSGTTTETKVGDVVENNLANKYETTDGTLTELIKTDNYRDVNGVYSGTTGGTTTEVKVGNVTESHSGTTTENKKGDVVENNLANFTANTTGNVVENTTGTTDITRTGIVTEDNKNNVVRTTSGTTTETFKGQVTENNQSGYTVNTTGNVIVNTTGVTTETKVGNVTENHSGTTTDNNKGNVIVNNQANFNMNTSGNTTITTTGNTVIHSDGAVGITAIEDIVATSSESSIIITANDDLCATAGDVAAIKGVNKTNVGIDCSDAGRTKVTNVYGETINERANTADTRVTSAYTSATTATTVIDTANTSATTATLSGNTLVVNEATSISAKTPTAYVSGTTLDINETNTDITSCGRLSANTNDFEVSQCDANGKFVVNSDDTDINGKTFDIVESTSATIKAPATTISGTSLTLDEGTSISAKTPSTTISGTNFTLNETNTTINSCGKVEITTDSYSLKQCSASGGSAEFEFCNGYTVKSNEISLQQCGSAGTISISAQTQNIDGGNLTINESGNTAINTTGTTNVKSTGNTNIETNGANNKVTIQASGTGGDVEVFAKDTLCMSGGSTAALVGTTKTNIGKNCSDAGQTTTLNLNGTTINETGTTVNISGSTAANVSGATVVVSGNTTNISGATTLNLSGETINESGTTNNNNFTTINNTATTINNKTTNFNITGTTYISGDTTISGDVTIGGDLVIPIPCNSITSSTVNNALCEVFDRSEVTWKTGDYAATDENLKWYELWQNGAQLKDQNGNAVRIDIPKDHILKDVSIVYGKANGSSFTACTSTSTDCHWYIKLVWNVFNPSTGHSDDKTVYLPADDFVTDIDDNNSDTDRGVNVNVWYDGKQNWVSATTSIKIAAPSGDKTFTRSNGNHSLTSYKLSYSHNGFSGEFDPFNANSSFTSPHSALSWSYGSVTNASSGSYDTSAEKSITIPSKISNLTNDLSDLKIQYGTDVSNRSSSTTYNGSATRTVDVPTSLSGISNGNVVDSAPTGTSGKITIKKNVEVSGTVTATGAIYSSDRNLKENIEYVDNDDLNKARNIFFRSYNFKDDESKRKTYGVIAQEVQNAGLDELVHVKDDGMLGVDYISLLTLKIASLEQLITIYGGKITKLEEKINELENKKD